MGEQRRQHRIGVALEVHIRGKDGAGEPFEESSHSGDVSRGGCSVETRRDIPVGTALEIEIVRRIAGPRGSTTFFTTGKVVRTSPLDAERRILGIQFIGPQFPTFASEETLGRGE